MQLIGQKNNINLINSWTKLPNFTIIQGDKNTGKHYLVLYLCEKFNMHYVKVNNTVKDVRNLINVMEPNSNTIYHLDNFDEASLQAKNALLKITEEPVPGNYIVITGGPQIKTLESRARRILMEPFTYNDLLSCFKSNIPDIDAYKLFKVGINTPAKIEYYKKYDQLNEVLNLAINTFEKITYITPDTIIPILKEFDDRYDKGIIDKCLLYLDMLISLIENYILNTPYNSYLPILNIIMEYKNKLIKENTLRRKMLIFSMLYEIYILRGL